MSPLTAMLIGLAVILAAGGITVWVGVGIWVVAFANQLLYTWAKTQDVAALAARETLAAPTFDE